MMTQACPFTVRAQKYEIRVALQRFTLMVCDVTRSERCITARVL